MLARQFVSQRLDTGCQRLAFADRLLKLLEIPSGWDKILRREPERFSTPLGETLSVLLKRSGASRGLRKPSMPYKRQALSWSTRDGLGQPENVSSHWALTLQRTYWSFPCCRS